MLPTSTRTRKTRATRKRSEVRREKIRRVRVAALTVEGEGVEVFWLEGKAEDGGLGAKDLSRGDLRERGVETKVGRAILGREWRGKEMLKASE